MKVAPERVTAPGERARRAPAWSPAPTDPEDRVATGCLLRWSATPSAVADLLRRLDGLLDPAIRPPLRQGASGWSGPMAMSRAPPKMPP